MTDFEAIIVIESGASSHELVVEAVQQLIDSGTAWQLQGYYGRLANQLLSSGDCSLSRALT